MPTDLSDLLVQGAILPDLEVDTRKSALIALARVLGDKTGVDFNEIFQCVMERERLGSTGVGDGVAIPHARIDGVSAPVGAFAQLKTAVDFDAIDGRPCDLVFMLLAPESAGGDHLRALAQVSRAFRQADLRAALRQSNSAEHTHQLLCGQAQDAGAAA